MQDASPLTARTYWDAVWEQLSTRPVDPAHHYDRDVIALLERAAGTANRVSFLEVGCGGSMWLPHLAKTYGWNVTGVDYSEAGCALAVEALRRFGVTGTILKRDVLVPQSDLDHRFDIVYSAGLVEHFDEPAPLLARFARWLKPGGVIVTIVPNFHNPATVVQRLVGPQRLAGHRMYTPNRLAAIHSEAGFPSGSVVYLGFGGIIVPDWAPGTGGRAEAMYGIARRAASHVVGGARRLADGLRVVLPHTRWTSPSMAYLGRLPM
jgi:2-polyprenyl-6-hydroxyphenyl methylase/3-demethylubiquinone-9 3-methyltransferase